ncbi:MAG: hypothetical protein H5T91_05130 [Synergistetes bacterium]|nr:MAG: Uncharacterized protein XD52_1334 [bacterium 42_11]MBC7331791.1 hypothetical protein [Synergistota bacterium]MDK2872218.1 hypothetical protein [bacterium]
MIGWSVFHQEFTIEDHYYFSILKRAIKYKLVNSLKEARECKVIVFNYPEKPFTEEEIEEIISLVEEGRRVIALGYYMNEDNVASLLNELSKPFGLKMLPSSVMDNENSLNGDPYLVVTGNVTNFNNGVEKVLMPCVAPIEITGGKAEPFIISESSSSPPSQILGARAIYGKGEFILLGTCVFWDNFSINHFDNLRFSLNLLNYP